ncbi:MAG TPA: hypothetical protein VK951_06190 [Miltoncostaeaceae bacterium]|nr:hypothetical protein [Miltoncostaeaceae bacterium]
MLRIKMPRRSARSPVAFDERTGAVCDARCRAAARRERDLVDSLTRHGPR